MFALYLVLVKPLVNKCDIGITFFSCYLPVVYLHFLSSSLLFRNSDPGPLGRLPRSAHYVACFHFHHEKGSAFSSLVDSGRTVQGCVRYGTYRGVPAVYTAGITGTGYFGKFGTASIPVPETWVSSVRHQYRYRKLR